MRRHSGDTSLDLLLMLPERCRTAIIIGPPASQPVPTGIALTRVPRLSLLCRERRKFEAAVAPSPLRDVRRLARLAARHLTADGVLVAIARNGWPLRPLRAARIRRALAASGYCEVQIQGLYSTPSFPRILMPLDDGRMRRLLAGILVPGDGLRACFFRLLTAVLPAAWTAPRLLILARKAEVPLR